jgi:hypothetical protein
MYSKKMVNKLHTNVWLNQNIPDDILPVDLYRLFIEHSHAKTPLTVYNGQ